MAVERRKVTEEALPLTVSPFDGMAAGYDSSFTQTALGAVLRELVWERFDRAFQGRRRLLEIGCGTGEDAIYLARQGHRVVATDASLAMLEVANEKAERAGCLENIEFRCLPMEHVEAELSGEIFDGVYSNFGALNCTARMAPVVSGAASLLDDHAPLVWVVMGRYVPWEWVWFLARGEGRKAFRRIGKQGTPWRGLAIHYPTPAQMTRALRREFTDIVRAPLGFALPPTFAWRSIENSPKLFSLLTAVERSVHRFSAFASLADHYVVEARRAGRDETHG